MITSDIQPSHLNNPAEIAGISMARRPETDTDRIHTTPRPGTSNESAKVITVIGYRYGNSEGKTREKTRKQIDEGGG
ncbi:MAG: hypothetical protein KDI42_02395, partial [Gammaproteobacteria bacterium]|nr:hypothetical protein [Gammaproteobacteria bacterium]